MKTFIPKAGQFKTTWKLIDANNKVLGRLAAGIAKQLTGKTKATYTPNINMGGKVVVINADKIAVTGTKLKTKKYIWYTGYPGGLRSVTLEQLMAKKPTEALRKAVAGMLPKNKLQKIRLANLYIYAGEKHPHQAQVNR